MNSSHLEEIILELVEEYLDKKPYFSIKDISTYIANRTRNNPDINQRGIEKVIKSLVKKHIIIPGTKLMRKDMIENETRNEILEYIITKPGININTIMNDLGVGSNQALWHLSCLEKFQCIRSKKYGNQKVFFPFEFASDLEDLFYYFGLDIVKDILNYLKRENEPTNVSSIVDGLGSHHYTISKYLKILNELELIIIEKQGSRKKYLLDEEGYKKAKETIDKVKKNS